MTSSGPQSPSPSWTTSPRDELGAGVLFSAVHQAAPSSHSPLATPDANPDSGPDFHDVNDALESAEVVDVACVQRQADRKSGGCDEEIDRPLASRLSSRACDCGEDPSVSSRCFSVEREGFQGRLDSL